MAGRCRLPQEVGDAAQESWSQQDRRCGEALPMDGFPLMLLPDCSPISLSSHTPPATLGSCPSPALLVSSSPLGKCPLGESDSWQTTVIQSISTQITMLLICPKIHSKKRKEIKCLKGCPFKSLLKYIVFLMKRGRI